MGLSPVCSSARYLFLKAVNLPSERGLRCLPPAFLRRAVHASQVKKPPIAEALYSENFACHVLLSVLPNASQDSRSQLDQRGSCFYNMVSGISLNSEHYSETSKKLLPVSIADRHLRRLTTWNCSNNSAAKEPVPGGQ